MKLKKIKVFFQDYLEDNMNIIPFTQIKEDQSPLVGAKGLSLGALSQSGFPVPPGYAVTSMAFTDFLAANQLVAAIRAELDKININDIHSVDHASNILQDLVRTCEVDDYLAGEILQQFLHIEGDLMAIRSSVYSEDENISWAGELPVFFNIGADQIIDSIKECWAGLFSTRSLYYFYQKGIKPDTVKMSILVQQMIPADISGLVYTWHPVNEDRNQLVIEAGAGVGAVDEGIEITPETYVVQKKPFELIEEKEGDKLLSKKQIKDLVDICKEVEIYYGGPVEVDWCIADKLYILESQKMRI